MQQNLEKLVELYRSSSPRSYLDRKITGSIEFSNGIQIFREAVKSERGRLTKLSVDGAPIDVEFWEELLPNAGTTLDYEIRPHASSTSTFHPSLDDLLEAGSGISRGTTPSDYYLVAEDCYSEDKPKKDITIAVESVCEAIRLLAKVAHYHDNKNNAESTESLRLLFIHSNLEKQTRPLVIDTKLTKEIVISGKDLNLETLASLASAKPSDDPHFATRQGVFYSTISDFLASTEGESNYFKKLIQSWAQFNDSYQKNLNTYFSGFAFHKAKKEVAKTQLDLASELSKVISDITGKMLAIPLSFTALIAISNAKSLLDQALLTTGLIFASIIISEILHNQKRHFTRISHSKEIALNAIDGNSGEYPAELELDIKKMKSGLAEDEKRLRRALAVLQVTAWAPPIAATALLVALNQDRFCYNAIHVFSQAVSTYRLVIDQIQPMSEICDPKNKACLLFVPIRI